MDTETLTRLREAYEQMKQARATYWGQVQALLTPGTSVRWKRGRNGQQGVIEAHAYGDQFFVRNARTGKRLKLGVWDMIEGEAP